MRESVDELRSIHDRGEEQFSSQDATQLEEATTKLTELGTKSGLVPGTSPALLALLAGSLIFNLAAGSHLASTVLAEQVGTVIDPGG